MAFNVNQLCSTHFSLIRCFAGRCKCPYVRCDKALQKITIKETNNYDNRHWHCVPQM